MYFRHLFSGPPQGWNNGSEENRFFAVFPPWSREFMKYPARALIILLAFCFALPALATQRNVQSYGATGNGSTDDTAAINSAIAALVAGDELYFPCPSAYYKISSSLNTITVSNLTIDGQTGCSGGRVKIQSAGSGSTVMQIGNSSLSASTPITALAAELSTSFQANFSAIGAVTGDYVFLTELNDSLRGTGSSGQLHCSISGCRQEILKLSSVSGTTGTVSTALHFAYDPNNDTSCPQSGGCMPTAQKLLSPVSGASVHDLIFDGGGVASTELAVSNVVNSTFSNLTVQNGAGSTSFGFVGRNNFGNTVTNMTTSHASNFIEFA